jgi:acyl-CoA thioester hydrolase
VDGFRHVISQRVVFRDIDYFHHANNAAYSTWTETARMAYLRDVCGAASLADMPIVLGTLKIVFRDSARYDELLEVGTRMSRLGQKSFDLDHEIRGQDGRLVASVATTQVCYDHARHETVPVPPAWRDKMAAFEGSSESSSESESSVD